MASSEKLKILCLHGYRQNADVFRAKTVAFRSAMKKHADFVLMNAPHVIDEEVADSDGIPQPLRTWWFKDRSYAESGYQRSLDYIKDEMNRHGPYHGVLAFSQGASLAVSLAHLVTSKEPDIQYKISFMILAAGFINDFHSHLVADNRVCIDSVKCLLSIGESDDIISKEMSEKVVEHFSNIEVLYHPGGHGIPLGSAQKKVFKRFLEECKTLYLHTTPGSEETRS